MNEEKNIEEINEDSIMGTPYKILEETIQKVTDYLDKFFPEHLSFGSGQFTITQGSTQIMIIVRPFTDQDTCVECISQVVVGAAITPELMKFLLRKNAELHFGAFGLLFDDTITFSHAITGANLDENELITTLNAVATIADYFDDIIVDMAGGKRALDMNFEDLG